ncbi:hypothetical protein HHK36_032501 [Tetracentron sinense]|uniref:PCI domain-containing protein n=1 Tax=Tetracentron sinense TaxID=13715 RepID=A0A834YA73_TETSI|nr:hypothetical protein HHK36_032501 [Tetracentron sinense]
MIFWRGVDVNLGLLLNFKGRWRVEKKISKQFFSGNLDIDPVSDAQVDRVGSFADFEESNNLAKLLQREVMREKGAQQVVDFDISARDSISESIADRVGSYADVNDSNRSAIFKRLSLLRRELYSTWKICHEVMLFFCACVFLILVHLWILWTSLHIFFQAGDALIQLYHNFITDFETKINLLKLAHFSVIVSRQYSEKEAAIGYLEGVIEKLRATRELRIEEPILYVKMQIAAYKLEKGDQKECKKLLEDGKTTLDSMTDIDPSVYASYHWVSSQNYKSRQEFAEFYKSALLYLAYTSGESLSETFKLDLAFDLSLSALLGDNIYNFGELLAHPIVRESLGVFNHLLSLLELIYFKEHHIKSLLGTKVEWLYYILQAFNSGDLVRYQELCRVHKDALSAQPALVENEKKLLEKINILCLMEIIFSRPSEERTIPLTIIAERTKLSIEDVEYLLMKSLSSHRHGNFAWYNMRIFWYKFSRVTTESFGSNLCSESYEPGFSQLLHAGIGAIGTETCLFFQCKASQLVLLRMQPLRGR